MKMALNQTTMEREYNHDFIVCHFVFVKFSFTRTWQCPPLFYEATFLPKHRLIHICFTWNRALAVHLFTKQKMFDVT